MNAYIGTSTEDEKAHDFEVSVLASDVEGRATGDVARSKERGAVGFIEEELHYRELPCLARNVKARELVCAGFGEERGIRIDDECCDAQMSESARNIEARAAILKCLI